MHKKAGKKEAVLTVMKWPVQSPERNPIAPIPPALGGIGLKGLIDGSNQLHENVRAPLIAMPEHL